MIQIYKNNEQDQHFYSRMGKYFASLDIAEELERQLYNKDNSVWFVVYDNETGEVMGFASIFEYKTYDFLDNVYVLPKHRGKGYCSRIMKEIITTYYPNTPKPLRAIAINPKMIHLFNKYGFKEVGNNGKWKKFEKN